mgnify:CR=1 FL=1
MLRYLDTPMVCDAVWGGKRCCIACRAEYSCNCKPGLLYEKRKGVIAAIDGPRVRIKLDNGDYVLANKFRGPWISPRHVVGARVKVFQHDWKVFYRMVGR